MRWEQWEIDQLIEMYSQGSTSAEIGRMIGRSANAVRSFVKNNRDTFNIEKDEDVKHICYHSDYYYLPKYHWLIRKSWSKV